MECDSIRSIANNKITHILECTEAQENNLTSSTEEDSLNFIFFGTKNPTNHIGSTQFEEIQSYLQESESSIHTNPLNWWRNNSNRYPNISKIAKKYLSTPATSVPSERVFSTAGDIITAERNQLSPEHASILIFLSENSSLY